MGQVRKEREEIVRKLVGEIDFGKFMGVAVGSLSIDYEGILFEASGDVWKVLIDKTEAGTYEKVEALPQGEGVRACRALYRCFADVSGLGVAQHARRLMHPEPPKREEELAECSDVWIGKIRKLESHGEEFKWHQCSRSMPSGC